MRSAGQTFGVRQSRPRHGSPFSSSLQPRPHMFAVGPPTSVIVPRKSWCPERAAASRRIDSSLRPWIVRPWWNVIEQNEQSIRSEEHTSELQSHSDLVCRLLLEKKL